MKLTLRANIEIDIIKFFESRGLRIFELVHDRSELEIEDERDAPLKLRYNTKSKLLKALYSFGWNRSSILLENLFVLIKELVEKVNSGELDKLAELADTYLEFERMARKIPRPDLDEI